MVQPLTKHTAVNYHFKARVNGSGVYKILTSSALLKQLSLIYEKPPLTGKVKRG